MIEVDARGLSCPLPVLKTKQAIDRKSGDDILVTVDQETQVENITRLATGKGYEVSVEKTGGEYRMTLEPK